MRDTDDGVLVEVRVIPKASSNEIVGWEGESLKVRVTAAPDKGKANKAVVKLLADELDVAKSDIVVVKGETSRDKVLLFRGMTAEDVTDVFEPG